jgi:hypothetical protein
MILRVTGSEIKLAVLAWAKLYLVGARDITVGDNIAGTTATTTVIGDSVRIDVTFTPENKG